MATEKEVREYYNARYSRDGAQAMRPPEAYDVFLQHLGVVPGRTLLDVACGTGFLLKAAASRGLKPSGIDISDEAVAIARKSAPDAEVRVGRGEEIPFEDATFDYVTCLGSLEHFLDTDKGLQEMRRVSKPDARFCIMVPNRNFWVWKLQKESGTEQQAIHERLLSLEEWTGIFKRNGFRIDAIHEDTWHLKVRSIGSGHGPLQKAKRLAYQALSRLLPLGWTYQFVFILTKK